MTSNVVNIVTIHNNNNKEPPVTTNNNKEPKERVFLEYGDKRVELEREGRVWYYRTFQLPDAAPWVNLKVPDLKVELPAKHVRDETSKRDLVVWLSPYKDERGRTPNNVGWQGLDKVAETMDWCPPCLYTPLPPKLPCRLVNQNGKVLCDYGDDVFFQRGSSGICCGTNYQELYLNKLAVGKNWPTCVGSQHQSVSFDYDPILGRVKPISCEYFWHS
jgi:hypothetical protein